MRISSKGRYGLASMICLAQKYNSGDYITILSISEKLGISKIYLEQVFSMLKRSDIITSIKGAQGGYQLKSPPRHISALMVLEATEPSLFEKTEASASQSRSVENSMQKLVWDKLDETVCETLKSITLADLAAEADNYNNSGYMFYI